MSLNDDSRGLTGDRHDHITPDRGHRVPTTETRGGNSVSETRCRFYFRNRLAIPSRFCPDPSSPFTDGPSRPESVNALSRSSDNPCRQNRRSTVAVRALRLEQPPSCEIV